MHTPKPFNHSSNLKITKMIDTSILIRKNPIIFVLHRKCSIHYAVRHIIYFGQLLGLLVLDKIADEPVKLKFRWFGWKMFYSYMIGAGIATYGFFVFWYMLSDSIYNFVSFFWLLRSYLIWLAFLELSSKWSKFIQQWTEVEKLMANWTPLNLKKKFDALGILFLFLGILNYGTFIYDGIYATMKENGDLAFYYLYQYPEIFKFQCFSIWKAIAIEVIDIIASLMWQFQIFIIILLSIALTERIKLIKLKLQPIPVLHERQWQEIRKVYHSLSRLCITVNETIRWILLIAFVGKVFFMSVRTFNLLSPKKRPATFREYYTFLFTVGHFIFLCLYPAAVEEEKMECIAIVTQFPGQYHSLEMERLMNEIATGTVAIDVYGFFKVTRAVILNVVGVVLTLQLIFFQFDARLDTTGV